MENPLKKLSTFKQSIWLDYITRELITSGKLNILIKEDSLRGITSNPSIFEKVIREGHDYQKDIEAMKAKHYSANQVYEILTQCDIQNAADVFRGLYDKLDGHDGYVSLEVNPHLAHDAEETIREARRLWKSLSRPNVLIKVPGTKEGLFAIEQLIGEGISVNVTLLFGLFRYQEVVEAYLAGIELAAKRGLPLKKIVSVASFFLSRIDTLIDPILDKIIAQGDEKAILAKKIYGQVAIASAKVAYQNYQKIVTSDRFQKLLSKNAQPQRLLWASTSTKNPAYSDIKYVEALIGEETINTLPIETLGAYRDHGNPKARLQEDVDKSYWVLQQLPKLDIDLDKITQKLEDEGINKFKQSFDQLLISLEDRLKA